MNSPLSFILLALLIPLSSLQALNTNPSAATSSPAPGSALMVPALFTDHMVLQQKQADPVWGWDTPGTRVTVKFAEQSKTALAGSDGKWMVKLDPMPANATPQSLTITGSSQRVIQDVLIGEVWLCSGQSNMEFILKNDSNGEVETATADLPNIRLINVPHLGTQELKNDFVGSWSLCTPESAAKFPAIGFFAGRYLQQILHVPVGLIDDTWGWSRTEAFIPRERLEADPRFKQLMAETLKQEQALLPDNGNAEYAKAMSAWEIAATKAKGEGKNPPPHPHRYLEDRARPGNLFGGMIHPIVGYGIKGVLWYQGETNTGRPGEYAKLFPFLIQEWRKIWEEGDFPFYWVQLANFKERKPQPSESQWAEIREAQTRTMSLTNTGETVVIDLGEGKDIHPRDKHDVAARLVRWPLVKDYGLAMHYRSPEFKALKIDGNKATVTFDCYDGKLRPFETEEVRGFELCGVDKVWHTAKGILQGSDSIVVTSDQVPSPVAVRYAWADNPECNLFTEEGLAATPFRTDDWSWSDTKASTR